MQQLDYAGKIEPSQSQTSREKNLTRRRTHTHTSHITQTTGINIWTINVEIRLNASTVNKSNLSKCQREQSDSKRLNSYSHFPFRIFFLSCFHIQIEPGELIANTNDQLKHM